MGGNGDNAGAAFDVLDVDERLEIALRVTRMSIWEWHIPSGTVRSTGDTWARGEPLRVATADTALTDVHPDDLPAMARAVQAMLEGTTEEIEVEFRPSDNPRRWLLCRARIARRDRDGTPTIVLGSHVDVTAARASMSEQLRLQSELDRTQRLQSIGQLAGGIAHDFNNLMQIVGVSTELARRSLPPDHPAIESLTTSAAAVEQGSALTRQLLVFARRGDQGARVNALPELVKDALPLLRRVIPENIRIVTEVMPEAWSVIDAGQFSQVLMNLCANARDAMPDGGTIELSLASSQEASDTGTRELWVLRVSDSGPGFSQEALTHGLEPFFTTKSPAAGTGLGLSVVYGIASRHGGHVALGASSLGGAMVSIALPAVPAPAEPTSPPPSSSRTPTPGRLRLLLADDEAALRNGLRKLLVAQGYDVETARDGDEALMKARAWPADVAILDGVMPGLPTHEVIRELQDMNPRLKVIVITGYAPETFKALEGVEVVMKPFPGQTLFALIERLTR